MRIKRNAGKLIILFHLPLMLVHLRLTEQHGICFNNKYNKLLKYKSVGLTSYFIGLIRSVVGVDYCLRF